MPTSASLSERVSKHLCSLTGKLKTAECIEEPAPISSVSCTTTPKSRCENSNFVKTPSTVLQANENDSIPSQQRHVPPDMRTRTTEHPSCSQSVQSTVMTTGETQDHTVVSQQSCSATSTCSPDTEVPDDFHTALSVQNADIENVVDLSNTNLRDLETVTRFPADTVCVNLSHNHLSDIPFFFFFKPLEKLRVLDLSFNNLKRVSFCFPTNLEVLCLAHNQLTWIPVLQSLPKLRYVDFSSNFLKEDPLATAVVSTLPSLEYLWLNCAPPSYERLSKLPPMCFSVDGNVYRRVDNSPVNSFFLPGTSTELHSSTSCNSQPDVNNSAKNKNTQCANQHESFSNVSAGPQHFYQRVSCCQDFLSPHSRQLNIPEDDSRSPHSTHRGTVCSDSEFCHPCRQTSFASKCSSKASLSHIPCANVPRFKAHSSRSQRQKTFPKSPRYKDASVEGCNLEDCQTRESQKSYFSASDSERADTQCGLLSTSDPSFHSTKSNSADACPSNASVINRRSTKARCSKFPLKKKIHESLLHPGCCRTESQPQIAKISPKNTTVDGSSRNAPSYSYDCKSIDTSPSRRNSANPASSKFCSGVPSFSTATTPVTRLMQQNAADDNTSPSTLLCSSTSYFDNRITFPSPSFVNALSFSKCQNSTHSIPLLSCDEENQDTAHCSSCPQAATDGAAECVFVEHSKQIQRRHAGKDASWQPLPGDSTMLVERCRLLEKTLDTHRNELLQSNAALKAAEKEAEYHSSQVVTWQKLAAENARTAASLQKELNTLHQEFNEVQKQYSQELLQMRAASETTLADVKAALSGTRQQLVEQEALFAAEREAHREKLSALENTLKKEIATVQEAARKANEKFWGAQIAHKTVETQCDALRQEIQRQQEELERLRATCATNVSREDNLRHDLLLEQQRAERLQRELDACQHTLQDVQRQLDDRRVQWIPRQDYTKCETEMKFLQTELNAQKGHIERVTERNAVMRLEMEQLRTAIGLAEKRASEANVELQTKVQDLEETQRKLEAVKDSLASRTKELEDIKSHQQTPRMGTIETQLEEEKVRRRQAEKELQCFKEATKREREETLKQLQKEVERLEQDMQTQQLLFQVESAKRENQQKERETQQIETLKRSAEESAQRLEVVTKEKSQLKEALEGAEQLLKQRDNELRILIMELEKQREAHEAKLERVEQFFKTMNAT